jgi:hypothetical protein
MVDDISLVDGYTLPIKIVPRGINSGSCVQTNCAVSLDAYSSNENYGLGNAISNLIIGSIALILKCAG